MGNCLRNMEHNIATGAITRYTVTVLHYYVHNVNLAFVCSWPRTIFIVRHSSARARQMIAFRMPNEPS